jgi:hypothetical protein
MISIFSHHLQVQRHYNATLRHLQAEIADLRTVNVKLQSVAKWKNVMLQGKANKDKTFVEADAERQVRRAAGQVVAMIRQTILTNNITNWY